MDLEPAGPEDDSESDPGKWLYEPGDVVLTQCASCRHYSSGTFGAGCPAFPGGIPDNVLSNEFDHRKPHPDESFMDGVPHVRFEPRPDVDPRVLDALYRSLDAIP